MGGSKRVEFRKRGFARDVGYVVVYATQPVGQVIGFFSVEGTAKASPRSLWLDYCSIGGIAGHEFWRYYRGVDEGCAIRVGAVWRLPAPLCLDEIGVQAAPQSYIYLSECQFAQCMQGLEVVDLGR